MNIKTKAEYFTAMAALEDLVAKGLSNFSPEEHTRFGELAKAAEVWELNEYPMPLKPSLVQLLTYLMTHLDLSQTEFANQLEISGSLLSDILNGKKKPNLDVARQLHSKFQLDGNLILESL